MTPPARRRVPSRSSAPAIASTWDATETGSPKASASAGPTGACRQPSRWWSTWPLASSTVPPIATPTHRARRRCQRRRYRPALSARDASALLAELRGVAVSTVSRVRPNRSVATMLVVRAPMCRPSVTNGSWFTSTGTRGRPMAPETAKSARSHSRPASSSAMTWRFTVAMLSEVVVAMTSRPTGPRNRTARNTEAAAESARCNDGATT